MPVQSSRARQLALFGLSVLILAMAAERACADLLCDPAGTGVVADARAAVHSACDCDGASSASTWRRCVRDTLATLVDSGLSPACERAVLRIETRSTCGKRQVVCCLTRPRGEPTAKLVPLGHCRAPHGGLSCLGASPYLDDACARTGCPRCGNFILEPGEECDPPNTSSCDSACTVCRPDGCTVPSSCGNGVVDSGEGCDPPNGTTCSSSCTSCAPAASGEILLGCSSGSSGVVASAVETTLLVGYDDTTPGGQSHVAAKRLANDGTVLDAAPLAVSGVLPNSQLAPAGGTVEAATSVGTDFYVGWSTYVQLPNYNPVFYFGGRRIPASGPIASDPDKIDEHQYYVCYINTWGPLGLAPTQTGGSFLATWRNIWQCPEHPSFEWLSGVGPFFSPNLEVPLPQGNTSFGPAPIVRGASDVAAVWWNGVASNYDLPPVADRFLAASWVEPGTPTMILLSHGFSSVPPALAAVGDTFIAVWANGSELRAMRFTRAAGPLDPDGGILVATGAGTIGGVAAASDGAAVVAAWSESTGLGQRAIRAIRIATDGTIPDPVPIEVATSTADATVSVAANAAQTLVAFTRGEAVGNSVRAVLLGN